ncbi:MAG: leucine-rich repeat protein [Fibromonadales bacterium]|nr:leucine-rich repeat protein [Fibromonadales bacterium]
MKKQIVLLLLFFMLAVPCLAQTQMKLAVLEPEGKGFSEDEQWMLSLTQSSIAGDFNKYSPITIIDRQNLEAIMSEWKHSLSGMTSDEDAIKIGNLANASHILTGRITKTPNAFMLELAITEAETGKRKASYSPKAVTASQLENLSAVKEASADLLRQLGVNLTKSQLDELKGPTAATQVQAQTALAHGVVAERQGTSVAALSYYFQAATFDPSLKEAVKRSSVLNANISSGNMGDNVRNDIQWRKQWVDRLAETERFFDKFNKTKSMPYTLFYSKEINQGKINYQNETVAISIETYLYGSEIWAVSIERALQAVYDGLNATKRKEDWGLDRWPQKGVTELNAFERRRNNFSVVFELVNNLSKVIGRQALQAEGSWGLNWHGRPVVEMSNADRKTLNFQNVNANDITDNLTIRVASVNDVDAKTAAMKGILQIKAITKSEASLYDSFRFSRGKVQGFANRYAENTKKLVIPSSIWGEPVVSIGKEAFKEAKLTSVVIPNSVNYIDEEAFMNNEITNITIGANVAIEKNSFFGEKYYSGDRIIIKNEFREDYLKNNKKAGIYYIKTISKSEVDMYECFRFSKGEIQGFMCAESVEDLVIPQTIWGEPVTSIGKEAFKNAGLLTENAYRNSKLRSVVIPNGVTSIGELAFANAGLTSVVIPNSVTSIGEYAFYEPKNYETARRLLSITIGANVAMAEDSFGYGNIYAEQDIAGENSFYKYYNKNKKKAGTYIGKKRSVIITLLTGGFVEAPTWKYSEE